MVPQTPLQATPSIINWSQFYSFRRVNRRLGLVCFVRRHSPSNILHFWSFNCKEEEILDQLPLLSCFLSSLELLFQAHFHQLQDTDLNLLK